MVDTAYNIETDGAGQYEDLYSCRPPSLAMFITTIIIGALFIADEIQESGSVLTGRGPIAQKLIFNPSTKEEAWRYMSYMFVHIGYYFCNIKANTTTHFYIMFADICI